MAVLRNRTHLTEHLARGYRRRSRRTDIAPRRPNADHTRERIRKGFTLIELVITISVGVIISGVAGSLLWNASRQRAEVAARGELYDMGSAAMEVMFRHLREISQDECPGSSPPCLRGNAQISTAGTTDLGFGSEGFRANSTDGTIEMTIDGGATWHRLATDISSVAFSYYDRMANPLTGSPLSATDRAAVRRIGVDIQLVRGGQIAHLRSAVYLRSFMNEVASVP
jgi:prepilin-type N-terminal cleavage/methylation domain-containing protein